MSEIVYWLCLFRDLRLFRQYRKIGVLSEKEGIRYSGIAQHCQTSSTNLWMINEYERYHRLWPTTTKITTANWATNTQWLIELVICASFVQAFCLDCFVSFVGRFSVFLFFNERIPLWVYLWNWSILQSIKIVHKKCNEDFSSLVREQLRRLLL